MFLAQHAHIENIKTVANLSNNKDVFMCILRFHARAGYLQHYETLLKEVLLHPAPQADQQEPVDQYDVELCPQSQCALRIGDPISNPGSHAEPINDIAYLGNVHSQISTYCTRHCMYWYVLIRTSLIWLDC